MALSIVVGIPDLVYTYMKPMETASSNLHASGLTNHHNAATRSAPCQALISQEAHLGSATV